MTGAAASLIRRYAPPLNECGKGVHIFVIDTVRSHRNIASSPFRALRNLIVVLRSCRSDACFPRFPACRSSLVGPGRVVLRLRLLRTRVSILGMQTLREGSVSLHSIVSHRTKSSINPLLSRASTSQHSPRLRVTRHWIQRINARGVARGLQWPRHARERHRRRCVLPVK